MFHLFKKKNNLLKKTKNDEWKKIQSEFEGAPAIIELNRTLRPFAGNTDHNLRIGFAVPLKYPKPGAMPSSKENNEIALIERRITELLQEKGTAVKALTITMGTFKEYIFYAKFGLDIQHIHEQLKNEISSHDIQCVAEMDKKWNTYKNWDAA